MKELFFFVILPILMHIMLNDSGMHVRFIGDDMSL